MSNKRLSLWLLAWPIMIEMFLQFLIGAADTLMVSRISDDAVAVVGISNQLFMASIIVFTMITNGAGVVIAQKIGAGKGKDARTVALMSIQIALYLGIIVSLVLFFAVKQIVNVLQIPLELQTMGVTYISVVGGGTVLTALMLGLSTVIRNTGDTKRPMYIALGMNVFHVVLNYLFIFGALGFPQWGLFGVGLSTVISRGLAVIMLYRIFQRSFSEPIRLRDFKVFDLSLLKEMFRIGWPLSINGASWTFSQMTIFAFVASMGAVELATRTYLNTLESFCFLTGMALSMAAQIQIAQLYGAKDMTAVYRSVWKVLRLGIIIVVANTLLIVIFYKPIVQLFTTDHRVISLGISVLSLNLILQPAKMVCMAFIRALSAVGDTRYMASVGVSSMWIISVGLTYVLGISLGWGLLGIYIAMILDEIVRGTLYIVRWRRRRGGIQPSVRLSRKHAYDPSGSA